MNPLSPQAPRLDPDTTKEPEAGSSQDSLREVAHSGACRLEGLTEKGVGQHKGAMFWPEHWRAKLCTCSKCQVRGRVTEVGFG